MRGMRRLEGGTFAMGSDEFYPEERLVHRVSVDAFWIDEHPVTAADYPDAEPELLVPG